MESLANGREQKDPPSKILEFAYRKLKLSSLQITLLYMDAKKKGTLPPEEYVDLTYKQKRVFKLITSGHSTQQISEKLMANSVQSIRNLHGEICKFFDVSTLTELLIKLTDKKLINPRKYIEDVKKTDDNLLKNVNTADISSLLPKINRDERRFLDAFVSSSMKGKTSKEIANLLGIDKVIVDGRISAISKKLGKARREHIAMWYLAATAPPASQVFDPEASDRRRETLQR